MSDAKELSEWMRSACEQAAIRNVFRGKNTPPTRPVDLLPEHLRPPMKKISPAEWLNNHWRLKSDGGRSGD